MAGRVDVHVDMWELSRSSGLHHPCSPSFPSIGSVSGGQPAANIQDFKPMVNVASFGMCTTPSNPQMAAATAAAFDVLAPHAVRAGHHCLESGFDERDDRRSARAHQTVRSVSAHGEASSRS
jgi:hypothetical protein